MNAQAIVLTKYPDAWVSPSPTQQGYYMVPYTKSIGLIGAGSTIPRAWTDAAHNMRQTNEVD